MTRDCYHCERRLLWKQTCFLSGWIFFGKYLWLFLVPTGWGNLQLLPRNTGCIARNIYWTRHLIAWLPRMAGYTKLTAIFMSLLWNVHFFDVQVMFKLYYSTSNVSVFTYMYKVYLHSYLHLYLEIYDWIYRRKTS